MRTANRSVKSRDRERPDNSWHYTYPGEKRLTIPRPVVQSGRLPFGDRYLFRLPYAESSFIVTNGTSALTTVGYTYRGNNMYDPRVETGGLQPMQYDLLSQVYLAYRVFETHVKLTFYDPTGDGVFVGYRVRSSTNPTTTAGNTLARLQEMDHVETAPLANTGSQMRVFKFAFRTAAMVGVSETQAEDFSMRGYFDGSITPGIQTLIEPFAFYDVAGDAPSVRYSIEIVYVGVTEQRKTFPGS